MKKNRKKIIIILLIVIALIITALAIITNRNSRPVTVQTEEASKMDIVQKVTIRGTVTGTDSAYVYSNSTNRIAEILVSEGERIAAEQNLARLEGDSSNALYKKAALDVEDARRNFLNVEQLYKEGMATKEEYLNANSMLKSAQLSLSEVASDSKNYVTSPIDGTVTRVYASVGKLAGGSGAEALFLIENIDCLQMKLNVSEYDIRKIKIGQKVEISSEIIGREKVYGEVTSIAPTGEPKNGSGNEMVIPVTVIVDKGDTDMMAGVSAKAEIITGTEHNALAVPIDSIMEDPEDGTMYVLAVRDGVIAKCSVTILLEGDLYTAIDEGCDIKEGDRIVLSPDYTLEDGMAVTVM